jgi:hypothetical protein
MVSAAFITQYSQSMGQYRQSFVRSDWPQELRRELRPSTNEKRKAKSIESSITKLPSIKASKAWAYGMSYPWTPQSIARARHAFSLYALWTASLETTLQPFQGWPPTKRAPSSCVTTLLDTPCHTPLIKGGNEDGFGHPCLNFHSSIQVFKYSSFQGIQELKHSY